MVGKIGFNGFLQETLNYNEKKVQQGKAELLDAKNYLQDADKLNFYEKQERMDHLNALRPDVTVNTLHAKISFHPSDQLTDEQLRRIAEDYMQRIGFEKQPYLVYIHTDTSVPHMHILSTIVQPDGERLKTHNLGRNESRQACDELEIKYNIEKAKDHKQVHEKGLKPVDVQKVEYGQMGSKEAMQQVIRMTLDNYKVGSLHEFNAILRSYNMLADPGSEKSRTHQHGGLHYKILNDQGQTVGTPIKASAFYFKPTLKKLEEKFTKDIALRKPELQSIRGKIDWALLQKPHNIQEFIGELKKSNVDVLARQNATGQIYGMTYIDHDAKVVVNGSTLDSKKYSANPILKHFNINQSRQEQPRGLHQQTEKLPEGTTKSPATQQGKGIELSEKTNQLQVSGKDTTDSQSKKSETRQPTGKGSPEQVPRPSEEQQPEHLPSSPPLPPPPPASQQRKEAKKLIEMDNRKGPEKPFSFKVFQPLLTMLSKNGGMDTAPEELKKDKRKKRSRSL